MTDREVPSKSRNFKDSGGAAESRIRRLKAGLALEQEQEQDGTNLYTEMYEKCPGLQEYERGL